MGDNKGKYFDVAAVCFGSVIGTIISGQPSSTYRKSDINDLRNVDLGDDRIHSIILANSLGKMKILLFGDTCSK